MKRIIIWPDIYKEHGHWLPCVSLAKSLLDAGYKVEFMGIPDCKSIVDPYLTASVTYNSILDSVYPAGYSLENKLEPKGQRWKPHHLLPITRGALDSVFTVSGNKVDLLISGYFTGLETLLIHHKYNVPSVTMTTYLRHPGDTPAMHAKTKLVYMPPPLAKKLVESTAGVGKTIDQFVAPMVNDPNRQDGLLNPTELIPCARDFDFDDDDWIHPPGSVHYVEPMVTRELLQTGHTPAPPPDDLPNKTFLIYGCVGSQVQDYESKASEFFKNMVSMMLADGMSDYGLVLAVGSKLHAELNIYYGIDVGTSSLPANVKLYDWASQIEILQTADVAFIHGGLATIKESIWEQVPMVIVPQGKDQMDNALRISRKGLGMVAQMDETSPTDLRKLLTAAKADTRIKKNLASMQSIFATLEDTKPSLTFIKGIVPPA